MTWLNLISGLVGLCKTVAGLFRDKQLIKAGEDKQMAKHARHTLGVVSKAEAARRAIVWDDPDGLRDDEFNRDNT